MTLEQKLQEFDETFGKDPENPEDYSSIGRYAGCDDCHENKLLRQEHREFVKSVHSSAVEDTKKSLVEKMLNLPSKFWEDGDHAVGGYISKQDLHTLLSSLQTNKGEE